MIRNATTEDLPRLLELGEAMHAESRYSIMNFDREKVAGLLTTLMTTDTGFLMVAEKDGRIIGGFAGIVSEHWFSHDKLASDIALFIEQDARGGMTAPRLLRAFLTWADGHGVKVKDIGVNTGIHTNQTGRLYEKLGGKLAGLLYSFEGV